MSDSKLVELLGQTEKRMQKYFLTFKPHQEINGLPIQGHYLLIEAEKYSLAMDIVKENFGDQWGILYEARDWELLKQGNSAFSELLPLNDLIFPLKIPDAW